MTEAASGRQPGMWRIGEVEPEGAAGVEAIGQQQARGLQLVLGVVRPRAHGVHRQRGQHLRIRGRTGADIQHRQEVALLLVGVARPHIEKVGSTGGR